MSDHDTSRVLKNPLLSASVTGLTFDDFQDKSILLPVPPSVATCTKNNNDDKESKVISTSFPTEPTISNVIESDIDNESFSEINLTSVSNENSSLSDDFGNVKQNLEEINLNSVENSLLVQAASSFSQLPTVASTVLSSFSKVIKDYSPNTNNSKENNSEKEKTLNSDLTNVSEIQPFANSSEISSYSSGVDNNVENNILPPRLYTPSEITQQISNVPPISPLPPISNSQNSYRITARKKTYAQIPGITTGVPYQTTINQSASNQTSQVNYFAPTTNIDSENKQSSSNCNNQESLISSFNISPTEKKSEERKSLFSFASSFVPPVLQNLSGLVQYSSSKTPDNFETTTTTNQFDNNKNQINIKPEVSHFYNSPSEVSTTYTCQQTNILPTFSSPSSNFNINKNNSQEIGGNLLTNKSLISPPPVFNSPANTYLQQENFDLEDISLAEKLKTSQNQQINLFSTEKLKEPEFSTTNILQESNSLKTYPLPPPPTCSGSNTFRLKKGTRLYKNPFSAEISTPDRIAPQFNDSLINKEKTNTTLPLNNTTLINNISINNNSISVTQTNNQNLSQTLPSIFSSSQKTSEEENGNKLENSKYISSEIKTLNPVLEIEKQNPSNNKKTEVNIINSEENLGDISISRTSEQPLISSVFSVQDETTSKLGPNENVLTPIKKENKDNSKVNNSKNPSNISSPFKFFQTESNENIVIPTASVFENIESKNKTNNNTLETIETERLPALTNYFVDEANNNLSHSLESEIQSQEQQSLKNQIVQVTETPVPEIKESGNVITNYFSVDSNQKNSTKKLETVLPDPLSFFDSFGKSNTSNLTENSLVPNNTNSSEDPNSLRIQNFFNNPPQNFSDSISELNYKLVGSGVINENLDSLTVQNNQDLRSISPNSNIVEASSSICSEFSSEFSQSQQQSQQNFELTNYLSKLPRDELPDEFIEKLNMSSANENAVVPITNRVYEPVKKHWFFNKNTKEKPNWAPFSQKDSDILEENYTSENVKEVVSVEGGRYDVNIKERRRNAVYWNSEPTEIRRCSWFCKSVESRFEPYEEDIAEKLEEEYKEAWASGEWRKKVPLPNGENVTFHGPNVIVHFYQPQNTDSWGGAATTPRPRIVKRGIEDLNIEPGETTKVDHLLLMVHGIGSACDLRFRSVEEVVDEFRSIATQLIQSHYKSSCDSGEVTRVEVLPVSWHNELHSKESGIDERLKAITLESIPKLRNFTNDTLVDVLFYTSPVYCENIMTTVCTAMNNIYAKYCERNPEFVGGVSLAGHSLGSLILFDLLCHQKPMTSAELQLSKNSDKLPQPKYLNSQKSHTEQVKYTVGTAGTGQPLINYSQLIFQPTSFFALGSPIGMFVTIRGIDTLGLDFKLPTCLRFYNIFHPYDPVAYRIEALVNPDLSGVRPVLISHHKGRKRMHLELKETMTRVSADIKQKISDTFKSTLDSVYYLTFKNKQTDPQEIQKEVDKVLDEQLKAGNEELRSRSTSMSSELDICDIDIPLGKLNNSRRIDYVLQEAPLEFFNEYLFALRSHVCYWDSEDTILFIMKEIYSEIGISPDSQIPQQSMTIQRPSSKKYSLNSNEVGFYCNEK